MNQDEIKEFIAEQTVAGFTLAEIQDQLAEKGVKLRFMELRLLASEIETVLAEKKAQKAAAEAAAIAREEQKQAPRPPMASAPEAGTPPMASAAPQDDVPASQGVPESLAAPRGQTTVTVSPIQRPGFVATGSVTFGSGVTADWLLDQTGRLGLDNASGQPDEQDIREFQQELKKAFGV